MEKEMLGRKVVFDAVTGSRAFGLGMEGASHEHRTCLLPLKENDRCSSIARKDSNTVRFLFLSNVLGDLMFSSKFYGVWFTDEISFDENEFPEIKWIRDNRERIFKANRGVVYEIIMTEWERSLMMYEFDPYNIYTSIWDFATLKRYYENGFESFYDACRLERGSRDFQEIVRIRRGGLSKDLHLKMLQDSFNDLLKMRDQFKNEEDDSLRADLEKALRTLNSKSN